MVCWKFLSHFNIEHKKRHLAISVFLIALKIKINVRKTNLLLREKKKYFLKGSLNYEIQYHRKNNRGKKGQCV